MTQVQALEKDYALLIESRIDKQIKLIEPKSFFSCFRAKKDTEMS